MPVVNARRFCVAPMMACTDRHFRYLARLLSIRVMLYTEMVTTGALLHGDGWRWLAHSETEYPLALQVGGADPEALAACARMADPAGFAEINLNVGCPSTRVQQGRFGACLMAEPDTVAAGVAAMRKACMRPVTVKTRIGIDAHDSYAELCRFIATVAQAGCATFIVHARKAWLKGLSPRENRHIPPLRYEVVYQLKQDFPALEIIVNGGIRSLSEARRHLAHVDGVMLGREVYQNPYLLVEVDRALYGDDTKAERPTRHQVIEDYLPYLVEQQRAGAPLSVVLKPLFGLFQGVPGGRAWRRGLSERCADHALPDFGVDVVRRALAAVRRDCDIPQALAYA